MRQPKNQALAPLISLQKLSQGSFELSKLMTLASTRLSIDDILNQCLPDFFKGQFKINSFEHNTLILTCNSAKLMTRFRFIEDELMLSLNEKIAPQRVHQIKIKIRPDMMSKSLSTTSIPEAGYRSLSKKNAQILLEEAEHTEDKKLKEILISLSKHAK
jgi:hypothetical protein